MFSCASRQVAPSARLLPLIMLLRWSRTSSHRSGCMLAESVCWVLATAAAGMKAGFLCRASTLDRTTKSRKCAPPTRDQANPIVQ